MVERLRSFKVSVEVDTNKATYSKEFDSVDEMLEWLEMLEVGDFSPTMRAADTCRHCGKIRKPIDISDEDYFCQRQGMCR